MFAFYLRHAFALVSNLLPALQGDQSRIALLHHSVIGPRPMVFQRGVLQSAYGRQNKETQRATTLCWSWLPLYSGSLTTLAYCCTADYTRKTSPVEAETLATTCTGQSTALYQIYQSLKPNSHGLTDSVLPLTEKLDGRNDGKAAQQQQSSETSGLFRCLMCLDSCNLSGLLDQIWSEFMPEPHDKSYSRLNKLTQGTNTKTNSSHICKDRR